jgi:hypothetical protein
MCITKRSKQLRLSLCQNYNLVELKWEGNQFPGETLFFWSYVNDLFLFRGCIKSRQRNRQT